ncbi:M67 family metallopeptidase [Leptolyngbya sp. FACHB-261]|uniref:M67 family metallopeptidase n=1 Tax=Leptolyngbya sp. FACHB-261 TaxID=2692806 RepID=UPI001686EF25|nr:M67 family metallopeptidase [Leptolyngbya sp. FACHB-261]MBD2103383.1 M67 family metallopeptidase [Leptolyngbya sp. FACHB-261]
MVLVLSAQQLNQICVHAQQTYPNECCGLMLGRGVFKGEHRELVSLWPTRNAWENSADNPLDDGASPTERFLIDASEILMAQRHARTNGLEIVGVYHSHPDHPAVPSEFDREYAWPRCSYVIVSVQTGQAREIYSWTLSDQQTFVPEAILQTQPL